MQHLVAKCIEKTKKTKEEGKEDFSIVLSGETPNSLVEGKLTLKADDEADLEEIRPDNGKTYRIKIEEAVDA